MKRLVRHARVLVTDGAKAIVLRNEGDALAPELRGHADVDAIDAELTGRPRADGQGRVGVLHDRLDHRQ